MHPIFWALVIFLPPCVASVGWLAPRTAFGSKRVPAYWFLIALAITYSMMFATALVWHKL
jgi:hypothetical protein